MSTFWRNWSSGQRLSAVVIAMAVLFSLAWSFTASPGESWKVLLEPRLGRNSTEFSELRNLLDSEGVPWRLSQKADAGRFEIEVRSGEDYRKALLLAAEYGLVDGDRAEDPEPGLFGGGLTDTSEKSRLRREEAQVRKIEKQIRRYHEISTVDLVITHGKSGRYATDQDTPDTALVLLQLKDPAPSSHLPARKAETVRKMVSKAFAIQGENIQVVDNNMRDYPGGPAGLKEALARDLREEARAEIRSFIEALYLGIFDAKQLRLGVFIDSPAAESASATGALPREEPSAQQGGEADSSLVAGEESRPQEPAAPTPRPGAEGGKEKYRVQVNLVLDIAAVKEHMARRNLALGGSRAAEGASGLAGRIEAYEREQEELLARQLPHENVRVTVSTEAFSRPAAEVASAPAFFTGLFADGVDLTWLSDPYIYGGGGALLLSLLLASLARIRARRKSRMVVEAAEAICSATCRETLEAVDQAGSLVRSNEETSRAVVKMWLSENPEVGLET
ncbi:MAG: hypothetical protein VX288_03020 [Planctomycetota bacterium]|nr:hypothetical protein [Planctomycetota bacterium]